MKRLAICPCCGTEIPGDYFVTTLPGLDLPCPACGSEIRVDEASEWLTSLAFGIPAGLLLAAAALGFLAWDLALLDIGTLGILAIFAFPYLTRYERADRG